MKKVVISAILLVVMLFSLTACGDETDKSSGENTNSTDKTTSASNQGDNETVSAEDMIQGYFDEFRGLSEEDVEKNAEEQMADAKEGETIAIFHVKDYGDITVKFFEDVAPKACENFITHAQEGYYDGVTFHRVVEEFMIQGGDPLGTGAGGESIWGEDFGEELATSVLPYRGALCMASRGTGTSSLGSQFFIVQANYDESQKDYFTYYGLTNLWSSYQKNGGVPSLIAHYTTFGQVIDGMDVVDKIASVETDNSESGGGKPLSDVVIETIEITTK